MQRILVTGAGGFIGHHLCSYLKACGYWVRGVDIKRPQWSETMADQFWLLDLRRQEYALRVMADINWVFHCAADMGGIRYIGGPHAEIGMNNSLIDATVLNAAWMMGVRRFFFASSACVYPVEIQDTDDDILLKESDAYPANPEGAYGWTKLHTEHLCRYYHEAGRIQTHVARLHNVYGPGTAWEEYDRRAKAPAELCRKVAIAKLTGNPEVEILGNGGQKRSFMYISDCIEGVIRLIESDFHEPLNIGRSRVVTINYLVDVIADIAGVKIVKKHIDGPQGVRSRSSDNSLCKKVFGWEPAVRIEDGMIPTYRWIEEQVRCQMSRL